MPISMECPSCMNRFSVPDTMAGRKGNCPECQFVLFVPRGETTINVATPPKGDNIAKGMAAPKGEPIQVKAVAPNPTKNARAVTKKTTAARPTVPASNNPFDFSGKESASPPRRGRRGGGFGLILFGLFALFALGGFLLIGAGGVAAWYFLGRAPKAQVAAADRETTTEEARKAEPTKSSDQDPPKTEDTKKDPPKNPGGKPIRDPIDASPAPKDAPNPKLNGRITLSLNASATAKPGERVKVGIHVLREDCKGRVQLEFNAESGDVVEAPIKQLAADVDRVSITLIVDPKAKAGQRSFQVKAALGGVTSAKGLVLTVETTPIAAAPRSPDVGDVKEVAILKGIGVPASWIALSADGSRLVVPRSAIVTPGTGDSPPLSPSFTMWDVNGGSRLWAFKKPEARFTFGMFSADGKTVIAVHDGVGPGTRCQGEYLALDSTDGREIANIRPAAPGEFTAAAVSPDGKYLATIYNGEVTRNSAPTKPFKIREVLVWDLKEHKVKWKLPGISNKGFVSPMDSLAFSPDGTHLAVCTGGSGAALLTMVSLEDGKETPAVVFEQKRSETHGAIEWLSDGIPVVRNGRIAGKLDPLTGQSKGGFTLKFPYSETPKPIGKNQLLPPSAAPGQVPDDWREGQAVLSADGSRLAAVFYHNLEHHILIWDVPSSKALGSLRLPDLIRNAPWFGGQADRHLPVEPIALSGDGRRLALSDPLGTVRVYDVSKISGKVKATSPALPPAEAATIRQTYESAVAKAREKLLADFDEQLKFMDKVVQAGKGGEETVARLKSERARFEQHGLVPWSAEMWRYLDNYVRVAHARAKALVSYGNAEIPGDLQDLCDKQVIARWKHQPGNGTITLYSSGTINDSAGGHFWTLENGHQLVLHWKNANAPAGYWEDRCFTDSTGLSYKGQNQNGTKVSGTLVKND